VNHKHALTMPPTRDGAQDGRALGMSTPNLSLRIVIVNHRAGVPFEERGDEAMDSRNRALRIGLLEAGYNIVAVLPLDAYTTQHIRNLQPDMVIVDAQSAARDVVDSVVLATRDDPRPIVLFTDDADPAVARDAIASGVSAYVVQGLQSDRVRSILEVASARFAREQALRAELVQVRTELSERKTVDEAKRILMKVHALDEAQAYALLRKTAMDQKLKITDLAQRLVDSRALLVLG
jgi:two-component system, response regulator / RNA-binding antiterminator